MSILLIQLKLITLYIIKDLNYLKCVKLVPLRPIQYRTLLHCNILEKLGTSTREGRIDLCLTYFLAIQLQTISIISMTIMNNHKYKLNTQHDTDGKKSISTLQFVFSICFDIVIQTHLNQSNHVH